MPGLGVIGTAPQPGASKNRRQAVAGRESVAALVGCFLRGAGRAFGALPQALGATPTAIQVPEGSYDLIGRKNAHARRSADIAWSTPAVLP